MTVLRNQTDITLTLYDFLNCIDQLKHLRTSDKKNSIAFGLILKSNIHNAILKIFLTKYLQPQKINCSGFGAVELKTIIRQVPLNLSKRIIENN